MCWYFPDSKHPSNLASGHSTKMTIFNSKILNEGQEYLILKLLKNWKLFMCKEVLNTILTINSSETLLWWLCNLLSMITMLLRLIGPLLIQGSRIQLILIIFVLTVFTAVSRSGAGAGCGGEWFIISSENQPRLPATNYVSDPVEAPTDGHCTAWLSPDLRAMFDDCRPQCANYAHRAVEIYTK